MLPYVAVRISRAVVNTAQWAENSVRTVKPWQFIAIKDLSH